jgi:hypothetical protein
MIIPYFPSPTAIYWRVLSLIVVGWLFTVVTVAATLRNSDPPFLIGVVIGTVFQQSLLASAWAALGPGPWLWRVPLSLSWACLMGASLALPLYVANDSEPWAIMYVLTMAGFWLVGVLPVWLVAALFRLRLRHQGLAEPIDETKEHQFGIAQLMIFTAFVAVVLGIGRLLAASGWLPGIDWQLVRILALLLGAQILIELPLLFGALLKRVPLLACLLGIVFGIGVTAVEIPFVVQVMRITPTPSQHEMWLIIGLNVTSASWVLIFAAVARHSGYQFGAPEVEPGIQYLEPKKPARAGYRRPESVLYIDDS